MGQDLRYAVRLLVRNPLFALTAIVSLAIGIGANTAIFTIASALLFRSPSGVADPARLVDIGRSQDGQGFDNGSYPNYLDIRARSTMFDGVYAYRLGPEPMSLGSEDGAERVFGDMVSQNYFTVLGTRPAIGRLFSAIDSEQTGAAPVVVLSHAFWQRRFNADRAVVGQTIRLNGRSFTVIGVAPESFHGTSVFAGDLWVPITMIGDVSPRRSISILTSRESVWLVMGGRLKPGVTVKQAQAELTTIGQALEREFPVENRGKGLRVVAQSPIPGNGGPVAAFFAVLMGVVSMVLAIACANGRRRAAGASHRAPPGNRRAARDRRGSRPADPPVTCRIGAIVRHRWRRRPGIGAGHDHPAASTVAGVTATHRLVVAAGSPRRSIHVCVVGGRRHARGHCAALQASRAEVIGDLKSDALGGPERQRLRNTFVVGQVAFSIVLVVVAALFARALNRAATIDPGFDPNGLELASLDLSLAGFTRDTGPAFASELIQRVRSLPGVEAATLAAMIPLGNGGMGIGGLAVPGAHSGPPRFFETDWNVVTPGYFAAMRMRLVSGRDFTDADRTGSRPVIIVNQTAARRWWPNENPIGKTLLQDTGTRAEPGTTRTLTVIAVASDAKYRFLGEEPRTFVYVPIAQEFVPRTTIIARSTNGQRLTAQLRAQVARLNPNLPIVMAQTFDDYSALGLVPQRVAASVSGSLGLVGLLLAALGIYGVTAYMVASRTREIGVRVALGAEPAAVVRMVVRQGMSLALWGAAIGLALAAGASRLLGSLLFGVAPADPLAFGGSTLLFVVIGLVACLVPARQAAHVDPMQALRHD
jgi:ABC-type antimicrobial peptide transport system permease subunit